MLKLKIPANRESKSFYGRDRFSMPEATDLRGIASVIPGGPGREPRSELRPWDWTNWGPPSWYGDGLGLTTANGRNSYSSGCKPCAIGDERHSRGTIPEPVW
jgi:hypothetical protein